MSASYPSLRLGLIADLHHGEDRLTLISRTTLKTLERFLQACADECVDAVFDLGDRINDVGTETDQQLLEEVAAHFRTLGVPRAHVLGNHDVSVARETVERVLGVPLDHTSFDLGGWHIAVAQAPYGLVDNDEALDWLANDLAQTLLPTLVLTHVVPSGESMIGNYWFQHYEMRSERYDAILHAQQILNASGRVVAVIGGHRHWNSCTTINGVHYLTLQSVADTFITHPEPASAWAILDLGERFKVQVFGNDPYIVELPLKPLGRRWLAPRLPTT